MLKSIIANFRFFVREYRIAKRVLINSIENSKLIIPRGKHTYGPFPVMLGPSVYVRQLYLGSRFGNFCSIAPNLKFLFRGKHMANWVSTYPFYDLWKSGMSLESIPPDPIIIGHDVWIASNVKIMQ